MSRQSSPWSTQPVFLVRFGLTGAPCHTEAGRAFRFEPLSDQRSHYSRANPILRADSFWDRVYRHQSCWRVQFSFREQLRFGFTHTQPDVFSRRGGISVCFLDPGPRTRHRSPDGSRSRWAGESAALVRSTDFTQRLGLRVGALLRWGRATSEHWPRCLYWMALDVDESASPKAISARSAGTSGRELGPIRGAGGNVLI